MSKVHFCSKCLEISKHFFSMHASLWNESIEVNNTWEVNEDRISEAKMAIKIL